MALSRREKGLLFRVRDLHRQLCNCHRYLAKLNETTIPDLLYFGHENEVTKLLLSISKTLAIEEGKQESDLEQWGIQLDNLEKTPEGRKRRCPPKIGR